MWKHGFEQLRRVQKYISEVEGKQKAINDRRGAAKQMQEEKHQNQVKM